MPKLPADVDLRFRHDVEPTARTDSTLKQILSRLFATLEQQEAGIRRDMGAEPLHQFRVALRRTRTLLGQMKGVFPHRTTAKFRREFAWLGKMTSATRDMDVYLSRERQDPLIPLFNYLQGLQKIERRLMMKAFNGARYRTLQKDWKRFLIGEGVKHAAPSCGSEPIIHAASKSIWRVYKKILKKGCKIKPDSPPTALHALRKMAKKLRYLLEFFQALYPLQKAKKMIKNLKQLQDLLGEFQDLQVRQERFNQFILAMEKEGGVSPTTRHTMRSLIHKAIRQSHSIRAAFTDEFKKFASPQNYALYERAVASKY